MCLSAHECQLSHCNHVKQLLAIDGSIAEGRGRVLFHHKSGEMRDVNDCVFVNASVRLCCCLSTQRHNVVQSQARS